MQLAWAPHSIETERKPRLLGEAEAALASIRLLDLSAGSVVKRRRKAGGGAWRAFLSHELGGRQFTKEALQELQRKYHGLSPRSKTHYKEVGEAGKQSSSLAKRATKIP